MSTRFLIAGAGLAGLATAHALARSGARGIAVVERESHPGRHASTQNARMIRALVDDPHQAPLALEGARVLADWAAAGAFHYERCGSLLVGGEAAFAALLGLNERDRPHGLRGTPISAEEARRRVPLLAGAPIAGALWCPDDGTIAVEGVIAHLERECRAAGVQFALRSEVAAPRYAGGHWEVPLVDGRLLAAEVLVDAGGAWAEQLATRASGQTIPLVPRRRHVMDLGPQPDADPAGPYVWDAEGVYFRMDGNNVLASPCDEDPVAPGVPALDPRQIDVLGGRLARRFPALAGRPVWRMWAGLRTFAADRQFVIGWDARQPALFWVAGLGGHGLTTAPAYGAMAARLLLAGPGAREPAFDPARFVDRRESA